VKKIEKRGGKGREFLSYQKKETKKNHFGVKRDGELPSYGEQKEKKGKKKEEGVLRLFRILVPLGRERRGKNGLLRGRSTSDQLVCFWP